MSRLRELRLHGFKTFADPTRFVFEPGVNAVIGPNGSGKSNMADAVRWVLGEQSNRSLRTRRADDVIFAGSEQRKPQGMAEAVLTLDNADGWLPIDFAEVSIGRRAYRSGESEYLVNGARARLRDVVGLLGEGRLGANELVVVGQGTVDAALSLRPEERRQLFEEAAGVKGLQVRKHEALARLARARDNLTRVTDIIAELRPQVRRLALQAQHQQEHDTLGQRARALVGESHRRREASAHETLGNARRRAAAAEAELEAHRAREAAARDEIAAAETAYWRAEAHARAAARRREGTREAVIRTESRHDALASRVEEITRAIEAEELELAEADAALQRGVDGAPADVASAVTAASMAEDAWRAASAGLAAADAALVAAEEELAEARRRSGEQIADEARRDERAVRVRRRHELLAGELAEAEAQLAAVDAAVPAAREAATAAEQLAAAAREAHEGALAALAEAQPRADASRRRAAELAARVGAMSGELEALGERAARRSRLGSRLAAAGWAPLLDAVAAPEEAWPAIEAVVGGELEEALIWQAGDPAQKLDETSGIARLVAVEPGSSEDGDGRADALRAVGAGRTLAEWVAAPDLPRLFWRTVVAPDVDALVRGWRDLPPGWAAVTEQGDVADARGIVTIRGREDGGSGDAARRHARHRELAEALGRLQAEQDATTADAARELAAVGAAARSLEVARSKRGEVESAQLSAQRDVERFDTRRQQAATRLQELRAEAEQAEGELRTLQPPAEESRPGRDASTSGMEALEDQASGARAARVAAGRARDVARAAWQAARTIAAELEGRYSGDRGDRLMREARRSQLAAGLPARREAHQSLVADAARLADEVQAAREADAAEGSAAAAAEAAQDAARAALLEMERAAGGGTSRLADLERAASVAAVEASRQEEALAALAREREVALESLADLGEADAAPTGELKAEQLAAIAALDAESLESELRRVRRTLGQIGSVNPFAVEEHRELSARLEDLSTQDADLSSAIGGTEELIARLDGEINEQFHAAFAAIGEKFDEFCRLLFAGGSASLQLGGGEDGEAPGGIEIVVRPPGKRLQRLAMLSGGERALTGVALLFAMLSVNPIPFCILDEVDAALDEANIGRFADALRKLAETIDFVVITHNRATIEVADTIYGVTMSDAAVSRVVSLRLADLPVEVVA